MLNLIRQHSDSWLIKGILWLIVLAFIGTIFYSWGMGGASNARGGVIASVEGEPINYNEYNQTFNNLVRFYREQFRNQFNDELIERLDIKGQALDSLIQKNLLLKEAERLNIRVTNEELADHIKQYSAFQKDEKFDPATYKNYLRFNRMNALQFEEGQRQALVIEKIEKLVMSAAKVMESEVMEIYEREAEKIKIDYVSFFDDKFEREFLVGDDEIKAFYEANKAKFQTPEQFKVQYVKLAAASFLDEATLEDKEIQDYYNAKITAFEVKKKFKARHILFRLDPQVGDSSASIEERQKASEKEAQERAEAAHAKIKSGEINFIDAAKEFSDDKTSGEKGGDLGEFDSGVMVPEFEAALDKLKDGEVSDVVRTPFGFHIIQRDGFTPGRTKALDEVKDEITQALKEIKADQKARRAARRIQREAEKSGDLSAAAKAHDAEAKTTGFFSRRDRDLPDIGSAPQFFEQAFSLKENQIGEAVHTPEHSYVIKLVEKAAPMIPPFEEVKEEAKANLLKKKNKDHAREQFEKLSAQYQKDKDLEKLSKDMGVEIKTSPLFSLIDSIPGVGNIQPVKDKIENLNKGEVTAVSALGRNFFIRINDRVNAGEPDAEQYKKIADRLRAEKGQSIFQDWITGKRAQAEILINQEML